MSDIHNKVNATKVLDTALDGIFHVLEFPNINGTNSNNFGPWARRGNILGHALCLLYIATDDTRIGSETD
jgi:hypothetical protein